MVTLTAWCMTHAIPHQYFGYVVLTQLVSHLTNPNFVTIAQSMVGPGSKTKQNKPNQTKPNQTQPNQTKPNQTEPNQTEPNQTKPNQKQTQWQKWWLNMVWWWFDGNDMLGHWWWRHGGGGGGCVTGRGDDRRMGHGNRWCCWLRHATTLQWRLPHLQCTTDWLHVWTRTTRITSFWPE